MLWSLSLLEKKDKYYIVKTHSIFIIFLFLFFNITLSRDDAINLDTFKRMVAFVMAYSFTEPASKGKCCEGSACCGDSGEDDDDDEDNEESEEMKPPMMVPMADMLNHITNHNAKLTFGSEALKMVTTRAIKKV